MNEFSIRRRPKGKRPRHVVRAAFEKPSGGGAAALTAAYPGFSEPDPEGSRRRWITGGLATFLHLGSLGILIILASLAPVIEEELIPVTLLKDEPPPEVKPAAAPKALAERRPLPFNPQVQSIQPQIVNPAIVAEAAPAIAAEALQMDAVSAVTAPTQIASASSVVVERVSAVNSVARATAARVDVANVGVPAVRGPVKVNAPVGPSVGPRQVTAATVAPSIGTALQIGSGSGSSVAEGVVSNRDVVGSPDGALVVSVDTAVGDGFLRGTEASGDGSSVVSLSACMQRPEVRSYLSGIKDRTLDRWVLPPGVASDKRVTLRFRLDSAGSASNVSVVKAEDNALGASAVDALRSASPFPPMPESVRCLTRVPIVGTFSNPVAG
ncbi:MAG: TonB family protein [Myxococcota bacterium]